MQPLFDYFKFARLLNINDGRIDLMGVPINIIPTSILVDFQKDLVASMGLEKAYQKIYGIAKTGSKQYNSEFIQKQKFKDKRVTLDWQTKVVTFAGWGNLKIVAVDLNSDSVTIRYDNSPFPGVYSKSLYPVDFLATGFTAGGVCAGFGKDLDAYESKCVALGHPYCEITVGTPEIIKVGRENFWKSLKLL